MIRWLLATKNVYFGNASAVRDYRSQLRGNKALWIWGAYLTLLICLGGLAYSQIVSQSQQSIASLQNQLTNFYHLVIGMLATVITLAAPALTASTITMERQRRSLDLIFSAPVKPRYLLVGKMIASLRYLFMLLVLALPVTAVCVVMGGATWGDVIGAMLVLLSSGIVMMAIGLLMSTLAPTTIGGIVWSYLAVGAYLGLVSLFGAFFAAMSSMGGSPMMGATRTNEAIWAVALSPFTASFSAPTFTIINGHEIPNWIFALVFALVVCKLLLAGAGSALSPFGSPETKSLRIHGLVFGFLLGFLAGAPLESSLSPALGSISRSAGSPTSTGPGPEYFFALALGVATVVVLFLLPNIVCFSSDGELKFQPDGIFSLSGAFRGTPSGALPYLVMMVVFSAGGLMAGRYYVDHTVPGFEFLSIGLWSLGFYIFWWGVGRLCSSLTMGIRGARVFTMSVVILLLAVPIPILSMIMASQSVYTTSGEVDTSIWNLYMLFAFSPNGMTVAWVYGALFTVMGLMMAFAGEANLRKNLVRRSK